MKNISQIRLQKRHFLSLQDGATLTIMMAVGISSLMEDALVNVIKKIGQSVDDLLKTRYNDYDGAEIDSILLEDYLGN